MIQILEHPLFEVTSDYVRPMFIAAAHHVRGNSDRQSEAQAENRARMTIADHYAADVFRRLSGIGKTLQFLEDSRRLMSIFPTQIGRGRDKISRDRWVDYHYGYFTLSLASLPDIGVVLAAEVYQLGLAYRHCTADVVVSHNSIKGTAVATALRDLGKSVSKVKERRNPHIHRGEHVDSEELSDDDFIRNLKTITFLQSTGWDAVEGSFIAEGWKEARKEIVPRLLLEEKGVQAALIVLFDALLPVYRKRITWLKKVAGPAA